MNFNFHLVTLPASLSETHLVPVALEDAAHEALYSDLRTESALLDLAGLVDWEQAVAPQLGTLAASCLRALQHRVTVTPSTFQRLAVYSACINDIYSEYLAGVFAQLTDESDALQAAA